MAVLKSIVVTGSVITVGLFLIISLRLLILQQSITKYKHYWEKQNAQTAKPDSVLYIALGDSTAQSIGASQPSKGYVGLLAAQLAKASGHSVQVINLSVTGAKIQDVIKDQLPRLQQMNLPAGTVVTIEVGANDLGTFVPDTFTGQMDELMRQLPLQTVISDMPYFGGGRAKSKELYAVQASAIINRLALKYKLRVAPLHEITKTNDSFWAYGADFFHPSDRGYLNWYKAFNRALFLN